MVYQLVREWPPGFGGIERVAHEMASVFCSTVYSFDAKDARLLVDPLIVSYHRIHLRTFRPLGRLLIPLPSRPFLQLIFSKVPLHCHLPSPAVLLTAVFAKLINPHRIVSIHWHCFLETSGFFNSLFYGLYQHFSLILLPLFDRVITTSPVLKDLLVKAGLCSSKVFVLPCCLGRRQEAFFNTDHYRPSSSNVLRVLFIGRLDSYKRLDLLISSLGRCTFEWTLNIVGDGPLLDYFRNYSVSVLGINSFRVVFHGRLDETAKNNYLVSSDVFVLPSLRCNEAFGIVQLEAMAACVPSLAFSHPRSGMNWVSAISCLSWSSQPLGLSSVFDSLVSNPSLLALARHQSRSRYEQFFSRSIWLSTLNALFPHACN